MSTSAEITRISNAVSAIKTSISNKGVAVPSNSRIDTLPSYIDMISGGGIEVRTELDGELEPNTRYVLTDFLTSFGNLPNFLFPYSANEGDVIELNWENTYEYISYSGNVSEELQFGDDEPYCQIHAVYDCGVWWLTKVGRMDETDPTVPSWAKASQKPTYTAMEVGAAETVHRHTLADLDGASALVRAVNGVKPNNIGNVALSIPSDAHINDLIQAALSALDGNGVSY